MGNATSSEETEEQNLPGSVRGREQVDGCVVNACPPFTHRCRLGKTPVLVVSVVSMYYSFY